MTQEDRATLRTEHRADTDVVLTQSAMCGLFNGPIDQVIQLLTTQLTELKGERDEPCSAVCG